MRAAVYIGNSKLEVCDVPVPEVGPNQVLVEIACCAICGTDVHAVMYDVAPPGTVLGHEYSGKIVEVGSDITRWEPGDRVVGGGGDPPAGKGKGWDLNPRYNYRLHGFDTARMRAYAEYVIMEEWEPIPIPDGVPYESAALCEPAAVAGAWAPSDVPWTVSDVQLWLIWAVIGLSIATIVAVATSFYLYYWRRVLLAQPSAVVPEAWAKYLHQVGRRLSDLDTSMSRTRQELVQSSSASSKQIADMVETLMTLQNALDARDAEIRRLKNGYDAQVFRQFLFRFIRVQQALHDITAQADGDRQQLGMLKALMEDALDECGVEAFEPTLGKDWRREKGVADKPQNTKTDDPGIVDQIAEVLEPGYRLMSGEEPDVIRPAKVRIFALDE